MLENILLLSWNQKFMQKSYIEMNAEEMLSSQAYMAYPNDDIPPRIISEMVFLQQKVLKNPKSIEKFNDDFLYTNCKALQINDFNILVVPLPFQQVLGLIFSLESNPLDYRNELVRLLNDYLLDRFLKTNPKDANKNHLLLLTLFIDLRKYGSELSSFQEPQNKVQTYNGVPMIKVFVYGLSNAGKSSLMRLLSTGKFDHDYFAPTKKFRITNLRLDSGCKLVFWDMPGQKIYREDWLRGAQASNILLFVLDSADKEKFIEAFQEFWRMVEMYELKNLPLIFLINKIDLLSETIQENEIMQKFDLSKLNQNYIILQTSLPERLGISGLIDWFNAQAEELLLENGLTSFPSK